MGLRPALIVLCVCWAFTPSAASAQSRPPGAELPADFFDDEEPDPPPPKPPPKKPPAPDTDRGETGDEDRPAVAPAPTPPKWPTRRPAATPPVETSTAPEQPTRGDWIDIGKEADLRAHLEARAAYIRAGDNASAALEERSLADKRAQLGIRNIPLASATLIHDAQSALERGDAARAKAMLDQAAELSPDLTDVHWAQFAALARYDRTNIKGYLSYASQAAFGRLSGFRNQVSLLTDVLGIGSIALLLVILIFGLLAAFKYLRYVGHDVAAHLPSWVTELQGSLLVAFIWLLPMVFGLGVLVSVALCIATLIPYLVKRERWVGIGSLVALALVPVGLWLAAPLVSFHGSVVDALHTATSEAFPVEAEARLVRYAKKEGRGDFDLALVLALRARLRGDLQEAQKWYETALKANPSSVVAKNNLGRILYLARKPDKARRLFKTAANARQRAEPWLNMASLHLDDGRFDDARSAIEQARSIDGELARQYGNLDTDIPTEGKLIDVPMHDLGMWGRTLSGGEGRREEIAAHFWRTLGSRLPPFSMVAIGFGLLGLGLLASRRKRMWALSTACPKCGRPASVLAKQGYCEQCQSLYFNAAAVETAMRLRKERGIERFSTRKRWSTRLWSLLAGAGDVYGGQTLIGVLQLFLFTACLVAVVWLERYSVDAWTIARGFTSLHRTILLGIAVLLVAFSVRRGLRA